MKKKTIEKTGKNVKLKPDTLEKLKENKIKTGVPISVFVEQAIAEKFNSIKKIK